MEFPTQGRAPPHMEGQALLTEIEGQADSKDLGFGDTSNSHRGQVHGLDSPGEKCCEI